MKKYFFTSLLLIVILYNGSMAQSSDHLSNQGKRVSICISGGPSINWLNPKIEQYTSEGSMLGGNYGVLIDINFTKGYNYYFMTGITFDHSGGKLLFTETQFIDSNSYNVNTSRKFKPIYITIPTGIKLKTPSFSNFVIAGNFGLYHSFLLGCKYEDTYKIEDVENKPSNIQFKEASFFKESVFAGLGLEYIIKDDFRVTFYCNYVHTFTNFFNNKAQNSITLEKEKATLARVDFCFGLTF